MSEQTSTQDPAAASGPPAEFGMSRDRATQPLRMVGLAALGLGVAALAAATFVLSYSGIHTVALQSGITPRYARDYPLLLDAMLVIALAAVLALRGAGLPSRVLAWLTLLVVLGAAAGADTLHATGHKLQHNAAAITAAVLPWALVLIAFVLLLALLRHIRLRRHAGAAGRWPAQSLDDAGQTGRPYEVPARTIAPLPVRTPQPWNSAAIVPGFSSQLVSSAVAGAAAGAAVGEADPWSQSDPALDDARSRDADAPQEATAVAEPLTGDAEPLTDEAEPLTDAAEPPADATEPPADAAEPPTDEAESPADAIEPPTADAQQAGSPDPSADEALPA